MEFSKQDQIITHLININLALQNPHAKFEQYITDLSKRAKLLSDYIDTVTATFRETLGSLRRLLEDTKIDDSLAEIKGGVERLNKIENNILTWLTQYETRMKKNVQEMDIGQTLSEIKYIGNRLKSIEERLTNIEKSGIKSDVVVTVSQQERPAVVAEREDKQGEILNTLTDRERTVLVLRYGLTGESPRTYKAIGAKLKISPERVRQNEHRALRRLRQRVDMKIHSERDFPEGLLKNAIFGKEEG